MPENIITLPLPEYVKEAGSFAEVGRRFGVTGEAVKMRIKRSGDGSLDTVRINALTGKPIDMITMKKVWVAA